ncbi:MAG: hypothetical protein ACYC3I_25670 [Gemmataceae bacterium]
MTATTTKTRKTARVTHGKCFLRGTGNRTLAQSLDSDGALLTLHTDKGATNYTVQRLTDPDGATVGFRLTRLTAYIVDRKVYDIDVTLGYGWQCDCPDAQYQNRECKHVRSLRAALAHAGIPVAAPRQQPARVDDDFDNP